MTIRIISPGALTTVQDLGRAGLGSYGVPTSGAFDALAIRAANLLVSNPEESAGLELTMTGPTIAFDDDQVLALTGASFDAELNGDGVPPGRAFRARGGQTIRIARARDGVRGYLAVRGGIACPAVLGSAATYVAGGIGGVDGRPLAAGDVLRVGPPPHDAPLRALAAGALPARGSRVALRVVGGPHRDALTRRATGALYASDWRASPRSDRVGVRLDGSPLERAEDAEGDPEGMLAGAIQVPGDGLPIILGPDGPATGGYPAVATVITADLPLVAQARPGDTLRLVEVTVAHARAAWRDRTRALERGISDVP